jgi:hypothetical protein
VTLGNPPEIAIPYGVLARRYSAVTHRHTPRPRAAAQSSFRYTGCNGPEILCGNLSHPNRTHSQLHNDLKTQSCQHKHANDPQSPAPARSW